MLNSLFTTQFKDSPTLAINERVKDLWAEGQDVLHLGFGESRFPVHILLELALQNNSHRKEYLPTHGLPQLRTAVAEFYQHTFHISCAAAQVTIAPGSKLLLYAVQMILDGALLLPLPSWVSYEPQAKMLRKKSFWIKTDPKDGYRLSLDDLKKTWAVAQKRGHKHGLLLLNSPNNPSGTMIDVSVLQEIAAYCRQEGIIILSDEIYGMVTFGENKQRSIAEFYPEGTIIFSGVSKNLSLGGWRMGYAIVPKEMPEVTKILGTVASETWSAVAAPIQWALSEVFNTEGVMDYVNEMATIHGLRSMYLWEGLTQLGVLCAQPQGAFYLFPNFDFLKKQLAALGVTTSDDLAAYLLNTYHIATLPGSAFGCPPTMLSLRLSSSFLDMETDEKAQHVLDLFRKNGSDDFVSHLANVQKTVVRFGEFVRNTLRGCKKY
jgi:aspartate aminotransferase